MKKRCCVCADCTDDVVLEDFARANGLLPLAGVDEAGRGPLAGPVVACACILPLHFPFEILQDSKQLSEKERVHLYGVLTTFPGVVYSIQMSSEQVIDTINILQATLQAMKQAVETLSLQPHLVLVDGPIVPKLAFPARAVVRGDSLCPSISAASILAKVTRDQLVCEYDQRWPEWRFSEHKGYGTAFHRAMLAQHGILSVHRKSFEPIKSMCLSQYAEIDLFRSSR